MANTLAEHKGPALDRAFPSTILMGVALAIALALIAICAWKIFLLETEQEETRRERLLLERDRDAFLTYGSQLPQMTERHRLLNQEVAKLEDRRGFLEKSNEDLEKKNSQLDAQAARLTGAIAELQSQLQGLEATLAKDTAELDKTRPELASLKKEVATLAAQESALAKSIGEKRNQESALAANLEGLERSRQHAQEMLAKITEDREMVSNFEKQFQQLAAKFEAIVSRSDKLTGDYGARLEGMEKFLARMDQGMAMLEADRQALGANLDSFKKDRASYGAFLKQTGDHTRGLQTQVDSLGATNKKFASAMETVQGLETRLRNSLSAGSDALRKMAQEDAKTRSSLAASAESLAQSLQSIKSQLEQSQADSKRVGDLLARQREQLDAMTAAATDMQHMLEKNRQSAQTGMESGAKLGHAAQALATQADIFKNKLDLADNQSSQLEKLIDSQSARLKELGGAARQLADEIGENRRRGARLEVLLGEIQAMIDKPEARASEPDSKPGETKAEATP